MDIFYQSKKLPISLFNSVSPSFNLSKAWPSSTALLHSCSVLASVSWRIQVTLLSSRCLNDLGRSKSPGHILPASLLFLQSMSLGPTWCKDTHTSSLGWRIPSWWIKCSVHLWIVLPTEALKVKDKPIIRTFIYISEDELLPFPG